MCVACYGHGSVLYAGTMYLAEGLRFLARQVQISQRRVGHSAK